MEQEGILKECIGSPRGNQKLDGDQLQLKRSLLWDKLKNLQESLWPPLEVS
jgi:hypothetical protein